MPLKDRAESENLQEEASGWTLHRSHASLAAHLSDLLYLGPPLPDERATLAGRDDQPEGDWGLGADGAIGHQRSQVLEGDAQTEKPPGAILKTSRSSKKRLNESFHN